MRVNQIRMLDMLTNKTRLGSSPLIDNKKQTWVQTERASHEAWADLVRKNASAASLLHILVSQMDHQAAVVVSRATLAVLAQRSEATIKRAVAALKADNWIEVIQVGGKGGVNAYVVNSRVAWADNRDRLPGAIFTATVIASRAEQDSIDSVPLRRIPTLYPGERQLPNGQNTNPDLPSLAQDPTEARRHDIDPETGEIGGLA